MLRCEVNVFAIYVVAVVAVAVAVVVAVDRKSVV